MSSTGNCGDTVCHNSEKSLVGDQHNHHHNGHSGDVCSVNGGSTDSWKSDSSQSTSSSSTATSDAESLSSGHSPLDGCSSGRNDDFQHGGECCFAKTRSSKDCNGGSPLCDENGREDETLYLTTKLKFESQLLKDKLKGRKRIASKLFLSELIGIIFPWMGLVDRAIAKLEEQDVIQDQLYSSKQLLQLQKARNENQMKNFIELEAQLKEVNEDYGQLLVEHGFIQQKSKQEFHDGFSQTESVTMVDIATLAIPDQGNSLSVQTEPCSVNVETQADEDVALDFGEGRNQSSQSSVESTSEEENGCETPQDDGYVVVTNVGSCSDCSEVIVGNCCEETAVAQAKDVEDASAAGETQGISCLPNERMPNDEYPAPPETDGDQPLLSNHIREHDRELDPDVTSTPTITWPCDHYKRLCLVQFECCEKFYPCHRCHNSNADCPERKLRSINAKLLKCLSCNMVQNITEDSHHCCKCGIEFSKFFCGLCQHFTGLDDDPYHCSKCGICRIRNARSFHCDNCGVCLDVLMRENHVCREGSAHDACCICLEDAFSGCQILPCSHKVHRDCAVMMIKNGVHKCPVCRQSFAHKLQRVNKSETGNDAVEKRTT